MKLRYEQSKVGVNQARKSAHLLSHRLAMQSASPTSVNLYLPTPRHSTVFLAKIWTITQKGSLRKLKKALLGNLFRKYCPFGDFWCTLKNKGSEKSRRKEVLDIVESQLGSSYWYNSYTLQNTSLQKNKLSEEGCSVWAETSLRTHFVWGASMFRSTLVNTMQLATWDCPQAGGVLPQCSCKGGREIRV